MEVAGGGISRICTMSRTFQISPLLDLVRTVAAARQSKTSPVSVLLLKKYFRQVDSKVVAHPSALLTLLCQSANSLLL